MLKLKPIFLEILVLQFTVMIISVINMTVTDDIFHAAHKPVFASAYLQDKIEYEDIILNLALRYDYIDIDNLQMVDPTRPDYSINKADNILIATGWEKVPTFSAVSPRIGLSFPVTDKTVFHAQFGKFIQQYDLNESYVGYDYYAYQLTTSLLLPEHERSRS